MAIQWTRVNLIRQVILEILESGAEKMIEKLEKVILDASE